MKDILIAIIALLITGFIQSCTSTASDKANTDVVADIAKVANDAAVAVSSVAVPELYKGMADSPDNRLGGLQVGEDAPNIVGRTSDGYPFDLSQAIKNGPVAIVFYRGFWCGICTKHLSALEGEMAELKERGLQVYAITPETEEFIDKTIEKTSTNIPFIHDNAHKIMDAYKVTYKVTDEYESKVDGYVEGGLTKSQSGEDAYLPVPATYMIGKDGKIFYAHYEHNYGKRATASDMIAALESI